MTYYNSHRSWDGAPIDDEPDYSDINPESFSQWSEDQSENKGEFNLWHRVPQYFGEDIMSGDFDPHAAEETVIEMLRTEMPMVYEAMNYTIVSTLHDLYKIVCLHNAMEAEEYVVKQRT